MFKSIAVGASRSAVSVVAVLGGGDEPSEAVAALDEAAGGQIAEARSTPGFTGELGEVALSPDRGHLVLGLGAEADLDASVVRTAGARLVRALDARGLAAAKVHLDDAAADEDRLDLAGAARALMEGMALANWRVDRWDGSATKRSKPRPKLTVGGGDRTTTRGLKDGLLLAEATNFARGLAATPPNEGDPAWVASEARKLARRHGMKCSVIGHEKARSLGMGGLVAVGQGSKVKPSLVILEHAPAGRPAKTKQRTLVLVGKTMTFDTGGYSLKISGAMRGMKADKNGGMAVIGAMEAIGAMELPLRVVALLPTAENMISGDAYRADDIITMHNGATVEVTNTDAEGRLILADALSYACKTYQPTAIVDVATLTGGVVVGLGHFCAGLWCNDDELRTGVETAAERSGERVWRLPLWKEHRDYMRARHADLWNSAPSRNAHPIQGAAFLSHFVDESIPWAHLDIAGVSVVDQDQDLYCQGPTGFGVRLLAELARAHAGR